MADERTGNARGESPAAEPDQGRDLRLEALEERMDHLEKALEGLQDAVYRQAQLEEENIGELRKRMAPDQLARDLSQDARRRGL
jgi:hypothetical protein